MNHWHFHTCRYFIFISIAITIIKCNKGPSVTMPQDLHYLASYKESPMPEHLLTEHRPHVNSLYRSYCVRCAAITNRDRKSAAAVCVTCTTDPSNPVLLCFNKSRNCFVKYHDELEETHRSSRRKTAAIEAKAVVKRKRSLSPSERIKSRSK